MNSFLSIDIILDQSILLTKVLVSYAAPFI